MYCRGEKHPFYLDSELNKQGCVTESIFNSLWNQCARKLLITNIVVLSFRTNGSLAAHHDLQHFLEPGKSTLQQLKTAKSVNCYLLDNLWPMPFCGRSDILCQRSK